MEANENLVDHMRQAEIKYLKKKFNSIIFASVAAFARNTAAVNIIKATIDAARPTAVVDAAVSAVNQTAPLRSILKTRAMDLSVFQIYAYK